MFSQNTLPAIYAISSLSAGVFYILLSTNAKARYMIMLLISLAMAIYSAGALLSGSFKAKSEYRTRRDSLTVSGRMEVPDKFKKHVVTTNLPEGKESLVPISPGDSWNGYLLTRSNSNGVITSVEFQPRARK